MSLPNTTVTESGVTDTGVTDAGAEQRAKPARADVVRNRAKILAVADDLVAGRGVGALTMNEVATAANVGVGTVYRHFGDQAGLVEAMMQERERRLQEAMTDGTLGRGGTPIERIRAFLHAYADVLDTYGELMAAAETGMSQSRRYASGPYTVHREHLVALLTEARPDADAEFLAQALLAPLTASQFTHQRAEQGMSLARIKSGLDDLVDGCCAAASVRPSA